MTHTTLTGKALGGSGTQPYLRTTDEQFYTTAHLAYKGIRVKVVYLEVLFPVE